MALDDRHTGFINPPPVLNFPRYDLSGLRTDVSRHHNEFMQEWWSAMRTSIAQDPIIQSDNYYFNNGDADVPAGWATIGSPSFTGKVVPPVSTTGWGLGCIAPLGAGVGLKAKVRRFKTGTFYTVNFWLKAALGGVRAAIGSLTSLGTFTELHGRDYSVSDTPEWTPIPYQYREKSFTFRLEPGHGLDPDDDFVEFRLTGTDLDNDFSVAAVSILEGRTRTVDIPTHAQSDWIISGDETAYYEGGIDIGGGVCFNGGFKAPIKTVSSYYFPTENDYTILVDTTGGPVGVELGFSPTVGRLYHIKRITGGPNNVDIISDPYLLDGDFSKTLKKQYQSLTIQFDGSAWHIL